jgi:tetratricopeptide (TPR) repeat protein
MRPLLHFPILGGYAANAPKRLGSLRLLGLLLSLEMSTASVARAMSLPDCDYRGMAQAVSVGQIQKAYDLSIECEKRLIAQGPADFGEPLLRNQYLTTAQILTMQGKLDAARDRIFRASGLPESFLISSIEGATRAFLRERSLSKDEAISFYRLETAEGPSPRLAILYLDLNQANAAADAAQASLKVDPTSPTAWIVLGALLEKTDLAEALVEYKRALASAAAGNPSQSLIRYLELPRATEAIARLEAKH